MRAKKKNFIYDRTYISEGIDVNKTSKSKECNICHYCHFSDRGLTFQPNVCNGCHDLLMMSMKLSCVNILDIKDFDYRVLLSELAKTRT